MLYPERLMAKFREAIARLGLGGAFKPPFGDGPRPEDPDAPVREPRRGGPPLRTSGIALEEPDDDRHRVEALGRGSRR